MPQCDGSLVRALIGSSQRLLNWYMLILRWARRIIRRKSKHWLARNHNNVSEWSDISTCGLLFQWTSTIEIQLSMMVYYKADLIIISLKIKLFSPWYGWKITELALNNNHSLTHPLSWVTYFLISKLKQFK